MATDCRYLLTVLANGRPTYYERAMAAFEQHITPTPERVSVMNDRDSRLGMCCAYQRCWQAARESECEWVFHLEEDQVLLRPLHLPELVAVLDSEPRVKQMAFVRAPWGREIEHGGFIPSSPDYYTRRRTGGREWIETTRNWTVAPALFRTELAREFDWPGERCETAFGDDVLARYPDAVFGLWGAGECHVAHIGIERARGAHGY